MSSCTTPLHRSVFITSSNGSSGAHGDAPGRSSSGGKGTPEKEAEAEPRPPPAIPESEPRTDADSEPAPDIPDPLIMSESPAIDASRERPTGSPSELSESR